VVYSGVPRVGILAPEASAYPDLVREAGGEPVPLDFPGVLPAGGVALYREWVADWTQISCSNLDLDVLLLSAAEPAELASSLIAALRLGLPAVLAAPLGSSFAVALAALGFASFDENPVGVAIRLVNLHGPRSRELVEGFSLANALRAGLSVGAGPELLVHLAAVAREAGAAGFPQMIRVLAPESPQIADLGSSWFSTHGAAGLFAHLGTTLHDTSTVAGRLKEVLPPPPPPPEAPPSRLIFVRGRASGTEAVCRTDNSTVEISGNCRFYASEESAVQAIGEGAVRSSDLLVVAGCGPRGGPGLLRLDRLGQALDDAGLTGTVPVLTDGLPPESVPGVWVSIATPEAAVGGIIGRLRDEDPLRLDLTEGLIRTGARPEELTRRELLAFPAYSAGFGYAARYARTALSALEGAGYGW
jgi:dihydroxy-acid dehydratase